VAIRNIEVWPSEVLARRAAPVEGIDEELRLLVEDMVETMYAAPGIGLAAPQVGVSKRVVVIDLTGGTEEEGLIALVNPEIVMREGSVDSEEGCLSLPELSLKVCRAARVTVRGFDIDGNPVEVEGDELLARALQHEIDHLDGILLLDRTGTVNRELAKRKLGKTPAEAE
jgi:peptide deformylase